jgi:hypothetical protein
MPPDFGMVTGLAGACTVIWLFGSSTVFSYKAPLSVTPPTIIMVSSAVQNEVNRWHVPRSNHHRYTPRLTEIQKILEDFRDSFNLIV